MICASCSRLIRHRAGRTVFDAANRAPCHLNENLLGHSLGEPRVSADAAKGGGIDQPKMALHQFREGLLTSLLGVATERFGVLGHGGFSLSHPPT